MRFFTYVSVFIQLQVTATSSWQPKQHTLCLYFHWSTASYLQKQLNSHSGSTHFSFLTGGLYIYYIYTKVCFYLLYCFFFLRRCYIKIILQYYSLKRKQQILAACSNTFALSSKSVSLSAITQWHTHTQSSAQARFAPCLPVLIPDAGTCSSLFETKPAL